MEARSAILAEKLKGMEAEVDAKTKILAEKVKQLPQQFDKALQAMDPRYRHAELYGDLPVIRLADYPVIIMLHRTGNIMGTGGITAQPNRARELGIDRILEIGADLARSIGAVNGDKLVLHSPYSGNGIPATALVTRRPERARCLRP